MLPGHIVIDHRHRQTIVYRHQYPYVKNADHRRQFGFQPDPRILPAQAGGAGNQGVRDHGQGIGQGKTQPLPPSQTRGGGQDQPGNGFRGQSPGTGAGQTQPANTGRGQSTGAGQTRPTTPKPTTPQSATPTTPKPTTQPKAPQSTTPQTQPKPTTPKPSTPKPSTPKPAGKAPKCEPGAGQGKSCK